MTHRILHVGDIHVCSTHPRNGDRLAALAQIATYAQGLSDLAAVVIPGDLMHQKSTVEDRNALADWLTLMAQRAPVVLVRGNHDEIDGLNIFAKLATSWPIYVMTAPQVLHFKTPTRIDVACFGLPWPDKFGLVSAGVRHDQLGQEARALLDAIFLQGAAELDEARDGGDLTLMIAHATIGGATASTGQPQIGMGIEIDPALLARLGTIYKGFSHIHKHQVIHGAVYAGSICRLDFAEKEPKGFIEVEYQKDGPSWEHRWRFVPLDTPRQILIDGRLTREAFNITDVDGEPWIGPLAFGWKDSDIRVRYGFKKSEIGALDVAKIHAEFADCRSLKLEAIPDPEHDIRAPAVVAAPTLEGKVAAWCVLTGTAFTDGVAAKLTALQAQPAEAVLALVRASADVEAPAEESAVA